MVPTSFETYRWQDHVPALGRADLAVCMIFAALLCVAAVAMPDRAPTLGSGSEPLAERQEPPVSQLAAGSCERA